MYPQPDIQPGANSIVQLIITDKLIGFWQKSRSITISRRSVMRMVWTSDVVWHGHTSLVVDGCHGNP